MRPGKPSLTATWVAAWRGAATYVKPTIVEDPIAESLVTPFYAWLLSGARRSPAAMTVVNDAVSRVSGGRSAHMMLRTRAIDDAIAEAVAGGARQIVILGAGLDARAFRMRELSECTVFEVDHPSTQSYKRPRVSVLPPVAKAVRFVGADLEHDDVATRLSESGLDVDARTVFLMEGLCMYLSGEAIDATLRSIRASSASGSTLLVTYFERVGHPFARMLSAVLGTVREPVRSAFTPDEMAALLDRHGLEVEDDAGDPEWSPRYLGRAQPWSLERLAHAKAR
jgi:methyltransferase (TIGR00027 family)